MSLIDGGLTTAEILDAFSREISCLGGEVRDVFDDRQRLLVRGVLPLSENVQPGDRLKGGVALKVNCEQATAYPYVFRVVCSNGAIMAQAIQRQHIAGLVVGGEEEGLQKMRTAMAECCRADVFAGSVNTIRSAIDADTDLALNMISLFSRRSSLAGTGILTQIMRRFLDGTDRSRFGLMNAVTSVARDTQEPEAKWDLEEMGGMIAAANLRRPPHRPQEMALRQPREIEALTG